MPFFSGDFEAALAVDSASVDPHTVPCLEMAQVTATHLTLKAGSVAVDLHILQHHLGVGTHGLTAVRAQVSLQNSPRGTFRSRIHRLGGF